MSVVAEGLGLLEFAQAVHFLGAARPSLPEGLLGAEMLTAFSEWHTREALVASNGGPSDKS